MRLLILITGLFLLSCGQHSPDKKETKTVKDSMVTARDTSSGNNMQGNATDSATPVPSVLAARVNGILKAQPGNQWHVLNDREAKWISGQFDYFIAPKRKTDPDYPYIATSDFDGDHSIDIAAIVTDDKKINFQLVIIMGADEKIPRVLTWKEDIAEDAAISVQRKSVIEGFEGEKTKKINIKSHGINVEYFETASFVLYWTGTGFKRIQTGD
ncbi:MAG: hypothetical protein ABIT05_03855 [Chitinophagaceae bacterium]